MAGSGVTTRSRQTRRLRRRSHLSGSPGRVAGPGSPGRVLAFSYTAAPCYVRGGSFIPSILRGVPTLANTSPRMHFIN